MKQTTKKKTRNAAAEQAEANTRTETPKTDEARETLKATDDVLDEIDTALEGLDVTLATEYLQKGGQ